ncbi:MAG TPA: serine hydrolase [Pyrinomonadaceae bacterium]|nr:serine hydrolase [Pyrinomonadaceae bacterium]
MTQKRVARAMILCLLILTLSLCPQPQGLAQTGKGSEALRQRLQEKLREFHAGGKFPGANVGVALADGTTMGLAVGLSNLETKTPMTPRDLMLQGSVGKTYVSAVALQLVAEKKLGLDDPIEKYLGNEKWFRRLPNARDITVRMLMNHTSGLVRYEFKEQFTKDLTASPEKVWKPEELVSYILDTAAPFAAGKGWDYSDTNYIVLGMIIERITGSTYYRELARRILVPLGLRETVPSDRRDVPRLIQGYAGKDNPFGGSDAMISSGRMIINPQFEWTGGGIASTAEDLARWAKLLYEGKAFAPSLLPTMLEGVPARLGPEAKYGLGVIIRPTPLGIAYGHSGFFPGYITEMMYFPDAGIAIAVQVNTSVPRSTGKPLSRFITELAEVIIGEQKTTGEAAVMKTVNQLFASMEARQTDVLRGLFIPEGRLISTMTRQGQATVRLLSLDDFIKMVADTKEPYRERMFDSEVRVDGDVAAVWGRYDFHVGERLTNCGHNSLQLVRVQGEWKIASIASTIITQGCQQAN